MIKLILDTNIFSKMLNNLDHPIFNETIWNAFEKCINIGLIASTDESYRELESKYGTNSKNKKNEHSTILKKYKKIFTIPTLKECEVVNDIFKYNKFKDGIKEKSLRSGSPEADAFLVAKAKIENGILVTEESDEKPTSEKIPNICCKFNVPYMKLKDFYNVLNNINKDHPPFKDVNIYYELGKCKKLNENEIIEKDEITIK